MKNPAQILLLVVLALDFMVVAGSRLSTLVRAAALQGMALALLPLALWAGGLPIDPVHVALLSAGALAVKGAAIPWLLARAVRASGVHREVDPTVSLHGSLAAGAALTGAGFWIAHRLELPDPGLPPLVLAASFSTLLLGFFVLVARRQAITQAIGYLLLENGVFLFGQLLTGALPSIVEMGILLDLLAGIFIMGITIQRISRAFDHIDTGRLTLLRDPPAPGPAR